MLWSLLIAGLVVGLAFAGMSSWPTKAEAGHGHGHGHGNQPHGSHGH